MPDRQLHERGIATPMLACPLEGRLLPVIALDLYVNPITKQSISI
jgi:hypothetical protein